MAKEVDPFADTEDDGIDPFDQPAGGGTFTKAADIEGELVLFYPIKIEDVPKPTQFGGKPGETIQRATADTIVLTGEYAGTEYERQFWSQPGIVGPLETALRKNRKAVLGRVVKAPNKAAKDAGIDTPEKFRAAYEKFLADPRKNKEPGSFWKIDRYSDEDAAIAREYLASNPR